MKRKSTHWNPDQDTSDLNGKRMRTRSNAIKEKIDHEGSQKSNSNKNNKKVKAVFEEDQDQVEFEVDGIDEEFMSEDEGGESVNNNATRTPEGGRKGKTPPELAKSKGRASPRAKKFREMVAHASTHYDQNEGDDGDGRPDSEREDEE